MHASVAIDIGDSARLQLAAALTTLDIDPPRALAGAARRVLASPAMRRRVFHESLHHHTLPMVARHLGARAADLDPRVPVLVDAFSIFVGGLYDYLMPVVADMRAAGVETMLLKGGDLMVSCYPPNLARMMLDLDLLVRQKNLSQARESFAARGFVQGYYDRASARIIRLSEALPDGKPPGDHYELLPYMKMCEVPSLAAHGPMLVELVGDDYKLAAVDGKLLYVLEYDVHYNLSLKLEEDFVWRAPRRLRFSRDEWVYAQSATALFWFVAARVYNEVLLHDERTLRQFIDAIAIVKSLGRRIDWDQLARVADEYQLHGTLFYVGRHINELAGPLVPASLIRHCDPARHRARDYGDFFAKLVDRTVVHTVL